MSITDDLATLFIEESPPVDGLTVLDFGCGSGHAAVEFIARGARQAVAYDHNAARGKIARENFVPVFSYLPECLKVDLIWCSHVLEHVKNPIKLLTEFTELGQTLWLAVPSSYEGYVMGHLNNYTMPLLVELLRRAGWDVRHGSYKRFRDNLWVRVDKYHGDDVSRYPEPMESRLALSGRCLTKHFETFNWKNK